MDAQKTAREQGRQAALCGAPYSANPYAEISLMLCQAWRAGYQQGEVEEAEGAHFRERA